VTKTLNVAMIGGGFMGKAHAMAYAAMPMFFWPAPAIPHRKVLVDVNADLAKQGAARYGFDESSADWKATIARKDVDVIDIVTPNDSHAEIAIAALKAGNVRGGTKIRRNSHGGLQLSPHTRCGIGKEAD
jgi:predicted dehydrogenase